MNGDHQAVQRSSADAPGARAEIRRLKRRLLLEAAIDEQYLLRLESRTATGRTSSRIVRPIQLDLPEDGGMAGAVLVTRNSDRAEFRFDLDEVDDVSLVTTRLRDDEERRGRWSVGDPVSDPRLGLGVVQSFRDTGDQESVVVRFDAHGPKPLPLTGSELRPLD
ncbi:MAG: hypothetical protein WD737_06670 [Gemmatimonadota bacterium]